MAAELVQLSNSHGNRYTAADRERAYQLWRISAGRSLRKLADLSGIAHSTLASWSKEERWQDRASREDFEEAESVRQSLGSVLNDQVIKSIETVVEIRDDLTASKKDRLNAAQWLAGVAGVAPVQKTTGTLIVDEVRERANRQACEIVEATPVEDLTALILQTLNQRQPDDTATA
jgi:transcriptional regulator with XRE-family HTH domain